MSLDLFKKQVEAADMNKAESLQYLLLAWGDELEMHEKEAALEWIDTRPEDTDTSKEFRENAAVQKS